MLYLYKYPPANSLNKCSLTDIYSNNNLTHKSADPLPTACKLKYHFQKDFLRVYENHQYGTLVTYMQEQNPKNFEYMFPMMINTYPNQIMTALFNYSRTRNIYNENFLTSLEATLKYIKKDGIYPYLMSELFYSIKNALADISPAHKNFELLKNCFEQFNKLLGDNGYEEIVKVHNNLRSLKKMRHF